MRSVRFLTEVSYAVALLSLAIALNAQQPGPHSATPLPAQDEPAKKAIKDHAEYEAYAAAVKIENPSDRATALEAFAEKYPRSVAVGQALTEALAAWQEAGNTNQVLNAAKLLLVSQPANIRAMAVVVALDRAKAAQSDRADAGVLSEICQFSSNGLNELPSWQKPETMTEAQFAALRRGMTAIFNAGAGTCALSKNDLVKARQTLATAAAIDSTDLQSLWQLAIADLESRPVDVNGFWYCARAVAIAKRNQNQTAADTAVDFCNKEYTAYHGAIDGWEPILVAAQSEDSLPEGFAGLITPSTNRNSMNTPTEPVQNLLPQSGAPAQSQPVTPPPPKP